ncbi:MAG: YegS/Rv2252/BmrU family lipid kinase [Actinobacteria bacterium]|nr:YegS/Rv2252/BmrU family lipid kinase [Actinomycetota bacterium]
MKNVVLLANPKSGTGKAAKYLELISEEFKKNHVQIVSILADSAEATSKKLQEVLSGQVDAVMAIGGDGAVHLAIQELALSNIPLYVLPCGTGNDFARTGGPLDLDVTRAVKRMLETSPVEIDLGRTESEIGTRWFGQVLSTGFDSLVNERANRFSFVKGQIKYTIATLLELPLFRPYRYEMVTPGGTRKIPAMLIAVANGASYGGGMLICPSADRRDGLFEVMVLHPVSKVELLKVFPKVFKGKHVSHPAVEFIKVAKLTLESNAIAYADGEKIGSLPINIEIVPKALRVWETR